MKKDLTPKQKLFVKEYLVNLNATQAAIRAKYSAKTASEQGVRLLGNVKVQEAIQKAMQKREKRVEVTQDQVIAELAKIAFGDARGAMSWNANGVTLKDSDGLPETVSASIAEVSSSKTKFGTNMRLRQHDKVKALELLGKHLGMFTDVNLNVNEPPKLELIIQKAGDK